MSNTTLGDRVSQLERQVSAMDQIIDRLDSRIRYMDAIQRAWIDREGPEVVQKMVQNYTTKLAATKMAEIQAKVKDLLDSKSAARALEVGPRSIVVVQTELDQNMIPEPQLLLAERCAPLIGAKAGDLRGKVRIVEVYDRLDGDTRA